MLPRALDHLVLAVRDLDAAAETYERLGFTVTARGVHPWGTWNRLVQLADRTFLELLAVGEPDRIVEAEPGAFSFGAFNRDFLARIGEGMSMLVLASKNTERTRAEFARADLPLFSPFSFERIARGPDGAERKVAFSLTFTANEALPNAGFFACEHHFPEHFWRAEAQAHANGAIGIATVTMVARDPADHHEFLWKFVGSHDYRASGYGLSLPLAGAALDVLTPEAFAHRFGVAAADTLDARFKAVTLRVADLGALARHLAGASIIHHRRGELLVVRGVHGVTLAFAQG